MFVVIEGLDASGKNSVSIEICARWPAEIERAIYIDKNVCSPPLDMPGSPGICSVIRNLHSIIYEQTPQQNYNLFRPEFWVTTQASWFRLLSQFSVTPRRFDSLVVCAGWYYKFMAKCLYKGLSSDWMRDVFTGVDVPDLIVVLDYNPTTTVTRRAEFSDTEVGYLDDFTEERKISFIEYQSALLGHLVSLISRTGTPFVLLSEICNLNSTLNVVVSAVMGAIRSRFPLRESAKSERSSER